MPIVLVVEDEILIRELVAEELDEETDDHGLRGGERSRPCVRSEAELVDRGLDALTRLARDGALARQGVRNGAAGDPRRLGHIADRRHTRSVLLRTDSMILIGLCRILDRFVSSNSKIRVRPIERAS